MRKIEILGTDCVRCKQLYERVERAIHELSADVQLEKVSDINEIVERGVLMIPGLVIDGELKSSGKVLGLDEIKDLIR